MNRPPDNSHFRVVAPARAYGMLVALCGLVLAVGLILPLALTSSAPPDTGGAHGSGGPIQISGTVSKGAAKSSAASAADKVPTTAQGVTASTIKVGVVLLDLSAVTPLGLGLPNFEVKLQTAQFKALFDEANGRGGINGRKLVPVFTSYNPLATSGPQSGHAICVKLAADEKVFAVIGYTYTAGTCASSRYNLPAVTSNGELEQAYRDARGLLVTVAPALERDARNWASALVKARLTDGHKLGIVSVADGGQYQLPTEAAATRLKALGHPVAVTGKLDAANTITELPALVQKMKSAGVDSVMLASDFLTAVRFVYFADAQHYHPQYLTSDQGSLAADGLLASASAGLNGAIGFTSNAVPPSGAPETPATAKCRERYNAIPQVKQMPPGASSALSGICAITDVFVRAVTGAGKGLNSRSFVQGVEGIGSMGELPGSLPGHFGPGKTDYTDELQPVRWSSARKHYSPDGKPLDVG